MLVFFLLSPCIKKFREVVIETGSDCECIVGGRHLYHCRECHFHLIFYRFDRNLGGLEMTLRLRDHLAREFNKKKKTKTDVFTNDRAMGKLYKEAMRVKQVLSANMEHYAQVNSLCVEIVYRVC